MTPTPTTTSTTQPPMRQSCDRCHKQKLRCTRAGGSNSGACDRCLRKRAQCVFSSSLPKGRPSIYRSTDESSLHAANARTSKPAAAVAPAAAPVPVGPMTPAGTPKHRNSATSQPDAADYRNGSVHVDLSASATRNSSLTDDTASTKSPGSISLDMPAEQWPWVEPMNWDGSQMDWHDHDSEQAMLNWTNSTNPPQHDATSAWIASFPGFLDCAAPNSDMGDDQQHLPRTSNPIATNNQPMPAMPGLAHASVSNPPTHGMDIAGGLQTDSDLIIAELAQLSVRLSPLHRSSYNLAELSESQHLHSHAHQTALIDDATFEAVAAWLARGTLSMNSLPHLGLHNPAPPLPTTETKSTGAMLYHIFSASNQLLEILQRLQTSAAAGIFPAVSIPTNPGDPQYYGMQHSSTSSSSSSLSSSGRTSSVSSSSNNHNNIIRYMVIACHTMLLNIFAAVLIILERDANPRHRDTAALGDIRLVSVVQLCSYLIKRQHQAMDLYLTSQSSLTATMPQDFDLLELSGAFQPDQSPSDQATRDAMKDLKMDLSERLVRLQRTLCI